VVLDFNASPGPLESQRYRVEWGPAVPPGAEPKGAMKVEVGKERITVAHGPGLVFELPADLRGLLAQVRAGKKEYLRPGSAGLWVRGADGKKHYLTGKARVARQGPLAVALVFEGTVALPGGKPIPFTVEIEFPRSKSWARVTLTLDDPRGLVTGMGADLLLNVPDGPTLVDFGAGTMVYASLRKGEAAMLRSFPRREGPLYSAVNWETRLGRRDALRPHTRALPTSPPAEGWAHVMDRQRCTALAVEGFAGLVSEAAIEVAAGGAVEVRRSFPPGGEGARRLRLWYHFVDMPVAVGALTSPQAMLAPLEVRVNGRE
jgi:hypothetical protein